MRLLWLGLLGTLTLAFVACGSDDTPSKKSTVNKAGSGNDGGTGGAADVGGAAGSSAMNGGGAPNAGASGAGPFVPPTKLSETGLFSDIINGKLERGVKAFSPTYQLWSDGAKKRRWVYLPPNSTIDTSDMNFWKYPVGTKLWKEFTRDNVRVETRLIQKIADDDWFMMAFEWNDDQTDADAVPDGDMNAKGTEHDIPDKFMCGKCHGNMDDKVLGFSALQLNHDVPGMTLQTLIDGGMLSDPPSTLPILPGTPDDRAALGYMHANCGMCHNDHSQLHGSVHMSLWEKVEDMDSMEVTDAYTTTVDQATEASTGTAGIRVVPGDPDGSVLFQRFTSTDPQLHMPPLATEIIDTAGKTIIRRWIRSLGGGAGTGGAGGASTGGSGGAGGGP